MLYNTKSEKQADARGWAMHNEQTAQPTSPPLINIISPAAVVHIAYGVVHTYQSAPFIHGICTAGISSIDATFSPFVVAGRQSRSPILLPAPHKVS